MSVRLLGAAFYAQLPPTEKLLLLAICDFANDEGGGVFPSVATLAVKSGGSERTVQRRLQALEALGLVRIEREGGGRGRTNRIFVCLDALWGAAKKGAKLSPFPPRKGDTVTGFLAGKGDNGGGKGDAAVSPDPSVVQHPEKRRAPVVLSDDQFLEQLRPLYPGVDIAAELRKMDAYLLTPKGRRRRKTRAFVVNWLNRCDQPIRAASDGGPGARVRLEDLTPAERAQVAVERRVRPGAPLEEVLPIARRALEARA